MTLDELCNLPMSRVETSLKQCATQFPELKQHILTPNELSSYIQWLIRTYGSSADIDTQLLNTASALFPIQSVSFGDEVHREDSYLLTNHDISVGRMLRYMPAHWHTNDFFEIYYTFSGNCPIHFKDEIITLTPGSILIIAPDVAHASPCYEDDCVLLYFMVRSSTFDKVFWNQIPPENLMALFFRQALSGQRGTAYLHFETDNDFEIKSLLHRVSEEFAQNNRYGVQLQNALLCEFFILLLRRYESTVRLPRTEDFHWKREFSAIFSYIQINYQHITQTDVAQKFHYSERQITRIIKNCTGMNFAQLILKLKMEQAKSLLLQGSISIENISLLTGYSTVSSFYRAFVKYYGCTPGDTRAFLQEQREKADA